MRTHTTDTRAPSRRSGTVPNQQKYRPLSIRPPEADRLWLIGHAERTGRPLNAVVAEAIADYRAKHEQQEHDVIAGNGGTGEQS
jgi:hypothetical protein